MAQSWRPAQQTVVQLGGEHFRVVETGKPMTSEEAFANCGWEKDFERFMYEQTGAGDYGITKGVAKEALRSDGIDEQDYAESEDSNEVTEEDWRKIRQLLKTQGLRVHGRDIDAATEFKEDVVPMMEFREEQLCDFVGHPSPKQLKYGAGKVNKYRKPAEITPLGAKTVSFGEMELMMVSAKRGMYLFLPNDAGLKLPDDPPKKPNDTFSTIYTEEIDPSKSGQARVNAARAWYRTALLYEQSATDLVVGGCTQKALGLWSMGEGAGTELARAVMMLRLRAKRARGQALKLAPDVIDHLNSGPAWAVASKETEEYWKELFYNGEKVCRASAAKDFKDFAFVCICEAISVYLVASEDKKVTENRKEMGIGYTMPLFGGVDSLPKLWESATSWFTHTQISQTGSFEEQRNKFRQWWLRAVMARGHSEWLIQELSQCPVYVTDPAWKPTESWRFLSPPPLECFDNNCQVDFTMAARYVISKDNDDAYYSKFNGTQLQMRDLDARITGVEHHSFAPGCPDFVYSAKAQSGWATDTIGLVSMDTSSRNIALAYHHLFLNFGLVDTLSSEASAFDRDLALCADGIVLEWEWDYYLSIFGHVNEKEKQISVHLRKLEQSLSSLLKARVSVTSAEAGSRIFEEKLYSEISSFLDIIKSEPDITYGEAATLEREFAIKTQWVLQRMLAPWAHVEVYLGIDGNLKVQLRQFESNELFRPCQRQIVDKMIKVRVWKRWDMTCIIFRRLESVRNSILTKGEVAEQLAEFATCFRKYLESGGDETTLPIVNSGTTIQRIQSPSVFRTQYMSMLPRSSQWESEKVILAKRARIRQSDDPTAMAERFKIKKYFTACNAPAAIQLIPRIWQLIEENATAPAPKLTTPTSGSRPSSTNPSGEMASQTVVPQKTPRRLVSYPMATKDAETAQAAITLGKHAVSKSSDGGPLPSSGNAEREMALQAADLQGVPKSPTSNLVATRNVILPNADKSTPTLGEQSTCKPQESELVSPSVPTRPLSPQPRESTKTVADTGVVATKGEDVKKSKGFRKFIRRIFN